MHWFDLSESTTVLECVIASLRCGVGYVCYVVSHLLISPRAWLIQYLNKICMIQLLTVGLRK